MITLKNYITLYFNFDNLYDSGEIYMSIMHDYTGMNLLSHFSTKLRLS